MYRIAKKLRNPIKVDFNTTTSSRGKYARVCVQIDLAKPLIPGYKLAEKKYNAVYEFIHQLCYKCGKMGHITDLCREHPALTPSIPTVNNENSNIVGT